MMWPLKKEEPVVTKPDENKPPEKTPAELIAESLKPLTDSMAAMRAEMAEMRKPPEPVRQPVKPEDPPSVLDDENAAFATRLTPIVQRTFEIEARMAKDEVRREYEAMGFGDLWRENAKVIDETLEATGLVTQNAQGQFVAQRGNPQYIRNVADMVIGRAARAGGLKHDSSKKTFFLEDTNASDPGRKPEVNESEGLSKKQIDAAKRFGIPLADYKKSLGSLEIIS
jgi:hypothetical protein